MRASRVSIVLTAWLGFAWAAHGQLMPRPQVKKPVSEAVSKALDEFAVRCAPEKEKALLKQMTQATAAIHDAVKLTDEERKTLEDAAKPIVTAAVEAWKPKFSKTMAGWMGVSTEKRALQVISQWRPEQFGANSIERSALLRDPWSGEWRLPPNLKYLEPAASASPSSTIWDSPPWRGMRPNISCWPPSRNLRK